MPTLDEPRACASDEAGPDQETVLKNLVEGWKAKEPALAQAVIEIHRRRPAVPSATPGEKTTPSQFDWRKLGKALLNMETMAETQALVQTLCLLLNEAGIARQAQQRFIKDILNWLIQLSSQPQTTPSQAQVHARAFSALLASASENTDTEQGWFRWALLQQKKAFERTAPNAVGRAAEIYSLWLAMSSLPPEEQHGLACAAWLAIPPLPPALNTSTELLQKELDHRINACRTLLRLPTTTAEQKQQLSTEILENLPPVLNTSRFFYAVLVECATTEGEQRERTLAIFDRLRKALPWAKDFEVGNIGEQYAHWLAKTHLSAQEQGALAKEAINQVLPKGSDIEKLGQLQAILQACEALASLSTFTSHEQLELAKCIVDQLDKADGRARPPACSQYLKKSPSPAHAKAIVNTYAKLLNRLELQATEKEQRLERMFNALLQGGCCEYSEERRERMAESFALLAACGNQEQTGLRISNLLDKYANWAEILQARSPTEMQTAIAMAKTCRAIHHKCQIPVNPENKPWYLKVIERHNRPPLAPPTNAANATRLQTYRAPISPSL